MIRDYGMRERDQVPETVAKSTAYELTYRCHQQTGTDKRYEATSDECQ